MAHVLTPTQAGALTTAFAPRPTLRVRHGASGPETVVPLIEGTVTLDGASHERTTLSAVVPREFAPESWSSALVPTDAICEVGFGITDGPEVRVAWTWLDGVEVERPSGLVTITAYSRATRVAQAGFPSGDRRYTGTTPAVVARIVSDALGVPVTVDNRGVTGPAITAETVFNGDPWQAVEDLMDAAGAEAYFDTDDRLVMRPVPKAVGKADWRLAVGPDGTITSYTVGLRRAPNVLRMPFQHPSSGEDVIGRASATGPAAASGPYGTFRGEVTRYGVVTQAQADAAAAEYLSRAGGLMRTVTFEGVPHPGIEVGDVVEFVFANGATETHRITRLEIPLTPGEPMRGETRSLPW
jgi:hypothetical protein